MRVNKRDISPFLPFLYFVSLIFSPVRSVAPSSADDASVYFIKTDLSPPPPFVSIRLCMLMWADRTRPLPSCLHGFPCMCVQVHNAIWRGALPHCSRFWLRDKQRFGASSACAWCKTMWAGCGGSEVSLRCLREGPFCSRVGTQSFVSPCQMDPCFSPHSCSHS